MPTMRPKMNLVFSGENYAKALKAGYGDRAEIHGTSVSWEMEQALIRDLIPTGTAERPVMRLYYGQSTVQDEVSGLFCDAAAGIDRTVREDGMRPLVELASSQSMRLSLDCTRDESYHLIQCWESVCHVLECRLSDASGLGDGGATPDVESDVRKARALLECAREGQGGGVRPEARAFFDVVLWNWDLLGEYSYTYRALMDVVSLADGWPGDARAREDFKAALDATFLPAE